MAINFKRFRDGINLAFLSAAPASAVEGDVYFNTTTKELNFHDGTDWQAAASEDYVNAAIAGIDLTPFLRHDGTVPMSGTLDMTEFAIVNASEISAPNNLVLRSPNLETANMTTATINVSDSILINAGTILELLGDDNVTISSTNVIIGGSDEVLVSSDSSVEFTGVPITILTPTAPSHAATKQYVDDTVGAITAVDVAYSNITSGLAATNVQDAIDEVEARVDATETVANAAIPATEKGAPLGVATLDGGGKVPITQLPSAIMTYEGVWNAATNTPTLADGVGDTGMVYRVGTAGTQDLGSGPISFEVGDYAIYNGTVWEKSDTTDAVASVNGFTGVVDLSTDDIDEGVTNLYFTTTRARTAAVVNSTAGAQTDQAPSVDSIKTYVNAQIAAQTGIDATRIADGSVDNTEFQYLNGVTSPIQTQLSNNATAISDHIADAVDAHDASAISYDATAPTNQLVATEVQAALTELDTRTNTAATPQFQDVQVLGTGLGNRLLGRTLALASSTGLVSGGVLTIGAPTSTFTLSAGAGEVVDVTNPAAPVVTPVTWTTFSNQTITNLLTSPVTYIFIDSTGAIVQQTTAPTATQRRQMIFLGRLNHANNVSVTFADSYPDYKLSPVAGFYDLVDSMAPFKIGGMTPSPNGANLTMNLSAGTAFFRSSNYAVSILNPNIVTVTGGTPKAFRKTTQTTTVDVADVTAIDPTNYDVGGVVTAVGGGAGTSTVQRIYAFRSGGIRVQYGQATYNNLATALSSLATEAFTPNPTIEGAAILLGYLALERTATDLSNPNQARFITAARFDAGGSASAGGTTSLQQAYLNSVLPQIVLNSTQGALTIDDAATPLGTDLFQVRNNAGTTDYLAVSAAATNVTNLVGSGTTGAVRLHNLTTTERNALTPANGMKIYNTTTNTEQSYINGSWVDIVDVTQTPKNYLGLVNGVNGNGNFELGSTAKWALFKTTLTSKIPTGTIGAGDGSLDSFTAVTADKLAGIYSAEANASGAITPGNGFISDAFTLDAEDRAKPFSASFYYNALGLDTPGTSSNSYAVYLYDVANSVWVQPSNVYGINQGGVGNIGKWAGEFQTSSNATSYRLAVICITATSGLPTTLRVDDFVVGPSVFSNGTPVTDWQDYSLTIGATTTPPTQGSGATKNARWRRVGDSMEITFNYYQTAAGSSGSGTYLFPIPSGFTIDSTKIALTTLANGNNGTVLGNSIVTDISAGASNFSLHGQVFGYSTTQLYIVSSNSAAGQSVIMSSSSQVQLGDTICSISFKATVPILGWSSSVQMSDSADTRVVDFVGRVASNQALTADVTNMNLTAIKDSHGAWNGSQYTIPVPGDYRVSTGLIITAATGASQYLYINGVETYRIANNYSTPVFSGTILVPNLKAGDVLSVRSSVSVTTSADARMTFSIEKVSGPSAIAATETIAARYSSTAGNSVGTSATLLALATRSFDTHGSYSSGVFTVLAAGKYRVTVKLTTASVTLSATQGFASFIYKNGASYSELSSTLGNGSANFYRTGGTDIVDCVAGDSIDVRALSSVATTLNTGAGLNYIVIERIGL